MTKVKKIFACVSMPAFVVFILSAFFMLPRTSARAAEECSIAYYDNVPYCMTHMVRSKGDYLGPFKIQFNKEKDNWNKPCLIKATLATADGTELETISGINCHGSKGEEFCEIATQKGTTKFSQGGKFKLMLYSEASGALLLEQPFETVQWDKNRIAVKGEWENYAAFMIKNDGNVKFRFYLTSNSKEEAKKWDEQVKKAEYVIKVVLKYQGKPVVNGMIKDNFRFEGTEAFEVDLSFEPAAGIQKPLTSDFFKGKDGEWLAAVFLGDKVLRKYPFKVSGGEIVPHTRQSADYSPKNRAITSLWPLSDKHGKAVDRLIWIEHTPAK